MISITEQMFDSSELLQSMESTADEVGAVVSFTGKMRTAGETGKPLAGLFLEHYPVMTQSVLEGIVEQAILRFDIQQIKLVHRVGIIKPNEPIVFVGVLSSHRASAFDACMMIMDYLKNDAPFWKKEMYLDGTEKWVDQKQSDVDALNNWD